MRTHLTLILLVLCVSMSAIGRPMLSVEFGGALNWLMEDRGIQVTNEEPWGSAHFENYTTTPYLAPVVGLGCELPITERFYAWSGVGYHPLSSELEILGIPYDAELSVLSIAALGGYRIWRGLSFEAGPQAYVVLDDIHCEQTKYADIEYDRPLKQSLLWGVEGGVSYAYGPWSARLHYTHTFTETEEDGEFQFLSLEARSLALTIGYRFYAF